MRLKNIGICEVMKDKAMESGIQDECVFEGEMGEIIHDTKWLYGWVLCNKNCHDVYNENQLLQACDKHAF
jgi:hypothetical protein